MLGIQSLQPAANFIATGPTMRLFGAA